MREGIFYTLDYNFIEGDIVIISQSLNFFNKINR